MLHIFVDAAAVQGEILTVTGNDVNHIKNVLRMHAGEHLTAGCEENRKTYLCRIEQLQDTTVLCRIEEARSGDTELPVEVCIFQGLPKSDKMELIIQKAVELGAGEIIPVETARAVVKLDPSKKKKKTERWQAIAEGAAKQSHRSRIPQIREPIPFKEAIRWAQANTDIRIIPYELQEQDGTRTILSGVKPGDRIAVFIGPEGGFEEEEVAFAREHGVLPVSLGKRILRTETAALTVLSWLIWLLEI